jgi:hypothetical protein
MALTNTQLTTVISNIHVSSGNTVVSAMYFCNYSASTVNFNLYAVPSGSSDGTSTIIYSSIQLAASDTYVIDWEKLVLGNGDTLRANVTANTAVTSTVSYIGV